MRTSWRGVPKPYLLGGALTAWSLLVRAIAAAASGVPAFYFPDSWNYVVLPAAGQWHPFHGGFIYTLWDGLILGSPTEASVVRLHQLVGIVATLLLWALLRRMVQEPVAFGAALLFTAQPLVLFSERTILTETLAAGLVAVMFASLTAILVGQRVRLVVLATIAMGLSSGALVALRPASRLVIVVPLLVVVGALASRVARAEGRGRRWAAMGALILLAATLLPAPLHVRSRNATEHGVAALTPASGTAVLAWWGWRLDCDQDPGLTGRAAAALAATCEREEPDQQLMWAPGPVGESMAPHPTFADTQRQLGAAAQRAMIGSPSYLAGRLASGTWGHAVNPTVNLERFSDGSTWSRRLEREPFPGFQTWFNGADPQRLVAEPGIFGLVRQSARVPGIVAVLSLVGAAAFGLGGRSRRSLRARLGELANPALVSPRFAVGVAAVGAIAGNEVIVALGGLPIFRYWVPILPAVVILAAVVVERAIYAFGSSAPQSTG